MVTILEQLGAAIKAAASIVFPQSQRWSQWQWGDPPVRYGNSSVDYAAGTDGGRTSSIVQSCILWMARAFPEAPLIIQRTTAKGLLEPVPDHPLVRLLDAPNPYYSGILLWMATLGDWMLTGNAYWLKVRSGAGLVVELWWVPSTLIEPRWPDDGSAYLSHYDYKPNAQYEALRVDPADVVHFRYGLDSRNLRKGLSPLASLFRELMTDEEASGYLASMLRNMGVPGVVISPTGDNSLSETDAGMVKSAYMSKFSGDRRGEPLVLSSGAAITAFGFSPEQMTVRDLRRIPEERVSAIFGTPAVVVGLGAGLDRSTFANYAEAREAAYESNIIPTQRLLVGELRTQLQPDFDPQRKLVLAFDLSKVRVLQADEQALHERTRLDLLAGVVTVDEAREALGLDALEGGQGAVLYVPSSVAPTDPAELLVQAPQAPPNPADGTQLPIPPPNGTVALPDASAAKAAALRVGPFEYTPDPLPAAVYDQAERRKLSRAWDAAFAGTEYVGMLDAEAVNGNGAAH
jgi:HK97 family phage portal protein